MRFTETPLRGAFVIELDLLSDDRGYFARTFDAGEFLFRPRESAFLFQFFAHAIAQVE